MELSAIYDFLVLLYSQKHFTIQCALQEEAKVPRKNLYKHRENMQTAQRQARKAGDSHKDPLTVMWKC